MQSQLMAMPSTREPWILFKKLQNDKKKIQEGEKNQTIHYAIASPTIAEELIKFLVFLNLYR